MWGGESRRNSTALLPPVPVEELAGRILFAFDEEGLVLPPSLILKDGSLREIHLSRREFAAGVPIAGTYGVAAFRPGLTDQPWSHSIRHSSIGSRYS